MAESKIKTVLFVMAMEHEANPLITDLGLAEDKSLVNPFVLAYKGTFNELTIALVRAKPDPYFKVDSVGTENASLSTYIGAEAYKPDLILSVGSSGGLNHKEKGLKLRVGDVCVPDSPITFFDREMILDAWKPYLAGGYPLRSFENVIDKLGFKKATLGTQDSFQETSPHAIAKKIDVIDMESSAVAKVSYWLNIPFYALRVISDVGKGPEDDAQDARGDSFENNLKFVSAQLASKLRAFLEHL